MSELPQGWTSTTIKELAGTTGLFVDGDWIESKDQDPNGNIRLLQLADIGDGTFLDKSNRWINEDAFVRLRCTALTTGDVLVARMPDPLGRACLMPALEQRCVTVVDVAALRVDSENIDNRWVMQTINSPQIRAEIAAQSSGTTRRRISRGRLGEMEIPLPPKAEQTRIANQLDTLLTRVQACNDRFDAIPALLKRFRQTVLDAAFNGTLTKDWRTYLDFQAKEVALRDLGVVSGGLTKNSKRDSLTLRKPYLRVANVHANYLKLGDVTEIGLTPAEFEKTRLQTGDLLIVEGNGSLDHIGRVAMWRSELVECSHQNHLIRWRAGPDALANYVLLWLLSPTGRSQIVAAASSSTGLHTLSVSKVGSLTLQMPSLEEQAEIVRRVEALFALADRIEARCTAARTQAQRLTPLVLAKAFRGELVPQDPNDEPASALLARIASANTAVAGRNRRKVPVNIKEYARAAIKSGPK